MARFIPAPLQEGFTHLFCERRARQNDGEKIRNIRLSELCGERAEGLTCCALIRRQGKRRERERERDEGVGWEGWKKRDRASFVQHLNNSFRRGHTRPVAPLI